MQCTLCDDVFQIFCKAESSEAHIPNESSAQEGNEGSLPRG
jgi:hypothetical protein